MQAVTTRIVCVCLFGIGLLAFIGATNPAQGAAIGFQVDSAQSSFDLTGAVRKTGGGSFPLVEPVSGSLDAHFGGTFVTDNDFSQLLFLGGNVDALATGLFQPGGTAADFAFRASLPSPELTVLGAIRNLVFGFNGAATTLFNNDYDMSSTTVSIVSGTVETDKMTTLDLSGTTAQFAAGTATLTQNATTQRLELPLDVSFYKEIPNSNYSVDLTFSGIIIASRTIPEPGVGGMLLVSMAWIAARRRARS